MNVCGLTLKYPFSVVASVDFS